MAKFELPVRDNKTGEIIKTVKRDFMPVDLYIRFQQLSQKVLNNELKTDMELFTALKPLFRETFYELTDKEYMNNVDIAEVLIMFRNIIDKSTEFSSGDAKNA